MYIREYILGSKIFSNYLSVIKDDKLDFFGHILKVSNNLPYD